MRKIPIFIAIKMNCNGKTAEAINIVDDTGASYYIIRPSATVIAHKICR